jgi:hypothetical protein
VKEKTNKEIKIASDNKFLSDNSNKVSLFNIENDFSGLANVVACFFPSMRHEMILRYRAETIAKIGIEAYRLAQDENIQINPIPPKIALPLIEKMSLEHEPNMYEKWAKLLIATSINPNPIHQQYADILSNLNNRSADILQRIRIHQIGPDVEEDYNEYIDAARFKNFFDSVIWNYKVRNKENWKKTLIC